MMDRLFDIMLGMFVATLLLWTALLRHPAIAAIMTAETENQARKFVVQCAPRANGDVRCNTKPIKEAGS